MLDVDYIIAHIASVSNYPYHTVNWLSTLLKEIHEKEQEIIRIDYLKHQIKNTKEQ